MSASAATGTADATAAQHRAAGPAPPPPRRLSVLEDMVAGSTAGCIARMCIAPLDVIKIRFQISEHRYTSAAASIQRPRFISSVSSLVRTEGWTALWKGNTAACLMVAPYCAISFVTYQQSKHALTELLAAQRQSASTTLPTVINLAAGSISGTAATLATYPLDLLRTRLAAQQEPKVYRSMTHALSLIVRHEGIAGLYAGIGPTLVGIVPLMATQFASYEWLKRASTPLRIRLQQSSASATSYDTMQQSACGFLSGVISKLITMPLDVIKKRYQVHTFDWQTAAKYRTSAEAAEVLSSELTAKLQPLAFTTPLQPTNAIPNPAGVHIPPNVDTTGLSKASLLHRRRAAYGVSVAGHRPFTSMWDCARGIVQNEGFSGLFKGTIPSLLKAGPNSAIIFLSYEAMRTWMVKNG